MASLGESEERIKIYETPFSYLKEKQEKQVLYLFLEIGDDEKVSADDIYERINKSECWKNTPVTMSELTDILGNFLDHNLIHKADGEDKTLYRIDSIPYQTIMFEEAFLHSSPGANDFLRDICVPLDLQLGKALQYNIVIDRVKTLLERMKSKGIVITKEHLFTAAQYCKNSEVLSLLQDFGCDFNACDEIGRNVYHYAILGNNIVVLNWLLKHVSEELIKHTVENGVTIFHFAAMWGNVSGLDWLLEYAQDLLHHTDEDGRTVFHFAAGLGNTANLDWLLEHAQDLLYRATNDGMTVFHAAAAWGNTANLDWFLEHAPDLLKHLEKDGSTVFHYAVMGRNTANLDWLLEHAPDLLKHPEKNGRTVFHYAAAGGDTAVLDWLFEHARDLLNCVDKFGDTVLDYAKEKGNPEVLDWFAKNAPEQLGIIGQTDT
jgi:ankyrin repeat protein